MFQNIDALVEAGHMCTAFIEPDDAGRPVQPRDHETARQRAVSLFGPTGAKIRAGFELDSEYDLIFATAWYTAKLVHNLPVAARKAYFVQDYEAWFNPMGDGYLMAENSYRLGLTPFTIGRWLTHKLHEEFGSTASYFDFCADLSVYRRDESIPRSKAVCFICQPEKPRRCTRLGLEALGILKHYVPDVQIYTYGSAERVPAWFECEQLGLLSVKQCSALYNRCMAGLCISSSNPSRIPFEMMAAGLPVVDLFRENNLYDIPEEGCLLAEPTPESIAKSLAMILADRERQERMSAAAVRFMADRDLPVGFEQFVAAVNRWLAGDPLVQPATPRLFRGGGIHAAHAWELTDLCGSPSAPITVPQVGFDHLASAGELAGIENSKAWRALHAFKRTWPYRVLANYRFGPGWDRVDPTEPPWQRLAKIKASRSYRLINGFKATRGYRWYKSRQVGQGAPAPASREAPIELRSLDVWDTVLRRRCHPDEVKLHTARSLWLTQCESLRPEYRSPWKLLQQRQRCEADLGFREKARGFDDEYRLEDVLAEWVTSVVPTPFDSTRLQAIVDGLVATELAQERHVSYADPGACGLFNGEGGSPVVLISDFYMSPAQLREIVAERCPNLHFDDVVTSCDVRLNKRSGRLFEEVQRRFGVTSAGHHHVGDNHECDVAVPIARGMTAQLYENPTETPLRQKWRERFATRGQSIAPMVADLRERLERECRVPAGSREQRELFELGRSYAPLYCGYVLYAIEEAIRSGVDRIWYFTREGEFFRALHEAIAAGDPLGMPIPGADLLEVSRLATFFASMREIGTDELMRIWTLYSTQSMRALFRTLDLDAAEFEPALKAAGLDADEAIQYPWQDARVRRLFADETFLHRMRERRDQRRTLMLRYLARKGITPETPRLSIVDVGWRGTIQDSLAYVLPQTRVCGTYLGLFRFLNPQPDNAIKRAFGPDENVEGARAAEIIQFVAPLEMLANSPNGSVLRYRESDGVVTTERERDPAENAVYENYTRRFQAGVLAAAPIFADWVRCHAITADELRPPARELLAELQQNPPAILARAYFSLSHNETFGVGGYVSKRTHFPIGLAASGMLSRRRASEFVRFLENTGWPQGFLNYYRLRPLCRLYNGYSSARARRRETQAAEGS